jgi:hypothetical protein
VIIVFLAAILANALWIIRAPQEKSVGASGMVYAAEGATLGFALFNLLRIIWPNASKYRQYSREKRKDFLIFSIFNAGFLIYFIGTYSNPAAFLNLAPGVNVFVHYVSFVAGFFVAILWWEKRVRSERSLSDSMFYERLESPSCRPLLMLTSLDTAEE